MNVSNTENAEAGASVYHGLRSLSSHAIHCERVSPVSELKIENWKLLNARFTFENDVTTIVGPVGSGKSSVLEAVFALFASAQFGIWVDYCTPPVTNNKVSLGVRGAGLDYSVSLVSKGQGGRAIGSNKFEVERRGHVPPVFFVPQDHGARSARYDAFDWCFTWMKLKRGDYTQDIMTDFVAARLQKICWLKLKKANEFEMGGSTFSYDGLSGGQVDAILCLVAMHRAKNTKEKSLLMLDEPGQNLGAHERDLLKREMHRLTNVQVITVTHHIEMLDRSKLPMGVVRFVRPGQRLYRKNDVIDATFADLESSIKSRLHESEQAKFLSFIREPKNLSLFFADMLLLVEGSSDVRTVRAVDEMWIEQGWSGLECCVLECNGKDDCIWFWNIFRKLFEAMKLRTMLLLDLDVLTAPKKKAVTASKMIGKKKAKTDTMEEGETDEGGETDTEYAEEEQEKSDGGTLGGHAYYTIDHGPNVKNIWQLLQPCIALANVAQRPFDKNPKTAIEQLCKRCRGSWRELRVSSDLLASVCDNVLLFVKEIGSSDDTVRSPDLLSVYVTCLNILFLADENFPAFVWPPRVADIEGVVFDKNWDFEIDPKIFGNRSIFGKRQTVLSKLDKKIVDNEESFYLLQSRIACDGFAFVKAALNFPNKAERLAHLKDVYGYAQNSGPILFSERNSGIKDWLAKFSATDFDGFCKLLRKLEHTLAISNIPHVIFHSLFPTGENTKLYLAKCIAKGLVTFCEKQNFSQDLLSAPTMALRKLCSQLKDYQQHTIIQQALSHCKSSSGTSSQSSKDVAKNCRIEQLAVLFTAPLDPRSRLEQMQAIIGDPALKIEIAESIRSLRNKNQVEIVQEFKSKVQSILRNIQVDVKLVTNEGKRIVNVTDNLLLYAVLSDHEIHPIGALFLKLYQMQAK